MKLVPPATMLRPRGDKAEGQSLESVQPGRASCMTRPEPKTTDSNEGASVVAE